MRNIYDNDKMKKNRRILISFLALLLTSAFWAQPCFNPWTYRIPITVTNSGASLSNHQVSFSVNTSSLVSAGKMLSSGGDIRVTDNSGTSLPFWIENGTMNTSTTTIWVKMTSIVSGSNTIYFFYGNSAATSSSNGAATFSGFDDFSGSTLDASLWSSCISGGGSVVVNGGVVTISSPDATNTSISSVITYPASTSIVEMKVATFTENTSGYSFLGEHLSSKNGYSMKVKESGTGTVAETGKLSSSGCGVANTTLGSATGSSALGIWSFKWLASGSISYSSPSISNSNSDIIFAPGTINTVIGQAGASGNFSVDWYRVRSYAASQPSCSVGSEAVLSPPATVASNNGPACSTIASVQLSTTAVTGATYSWSGPAGYTSNLQNPIISSLSSAKSGVYTATTTVGPCATSVSTTTVTINDATVGGTVSSIGSVCSTSNSGTLTLSGNTGSVVNWESASSVLGPFSTINSTNTSLTFGNINSTTVYRAVVKNGVCASANSTTSSVVVDAATVGGTISGSADVCTSSPSTTLNLSGYTGSIQKWQVSYNTGSFTDISNTTSALTHTNSAVGVYTYRAIVKNSSCSQETTSVATITVNAASVAGILAGTATICASSNTGAVTLSGNTGSVIRWESSMNNNIPWSTITNTTTALNYTNLNQTVYYRAVVQNIGCAEIASASIPITVDQVTIPGTVIGGTSVCSNVNSGTLTLTGNNGTVVKWQVSSNGGTSYNDVLPLNTTTSLIFTNLTTGTYLYRAVVQSGACVSAFSNSATVNVYPLPTINFSALTVCKGKQTVFTNSSSIVSGTITNYNWNFGNGISSTVSTPNYTYPLSGTYSVQLKATSNFGCIDSLTKSITVNATPGPNFSQTNVCLNNVMSFSALSSTISSGTISNYNWKFGNGTTSSGISTSNNYSSDGSYDVTLVCTSNLGCKDSVIKTVIVYPLPVVAFNNNTACIGTATNFINNSNISSGNLSYNWDFGDGTSSTNANSSTTFISPMTYSVELSATSNFGCLTSLMQPVIVNPLPNTDFSLVETCTGSPSGFTNTTTIATGSVAVYNWNFGDGNTSTVSNPLKTYNSAGTYTVTLTATSNGACVNSISKTVTVNIGTVTGNVKGHITGSANVCIGTNGGSFLLTGQTGTILRWEYQDAGNSSWTNVNSTLNTLSYSNLSLTRMYRVLTQYTPCSTAYSDTATVIVNPLPNTSFTLNETCSGSPSGFTNNTTIAIGSVSSYNWSFGDGSTSTVTSPIKTYSTAGSFTVSLTATSNNGCVNSSSQIVTVNIGTVNGNVRGNISGSANVCIDSNGGNFLFTGQTGAILRWEFQDEGNNVWTNVNSTQNTLSYSNLLLTRMYRVLTQYSPCSTAYSDTAIVIVNPLPNTNFTLDETCPGSPSGFTNTSSITTGGIAGFNWNFGDGSTSTVSSPLKTYSAAGNYTVTLTATSNSGCVNTATQTVTVNIGTVTGNVKGNVTGSTNVCINSNGGNLLLTGQTGTIIQWEYQDAGTTNWNIVPGNINTLSYSNLNVTRIFRVLTQYTSCSTAYSDTAIVIVNSLPIVNFSIDDVCKGQPSRFINSSTVPNGNIQSNTWDFGNGASSIVSQPIYTYDNDGTYSILLTVTSTAGCMDTLRVNSVVHPLPQVQFTQTNVCLRNMMNFMNSSSVSSGSIVSTTWNFGDSNTSSDSNPNYLFANDGVYSIELIVTSDRGCKDSITKSATVFPRANVLFNTDTVCFGSQTHFTNLTTLSSGNLTYSWNFGDGTNSLQINPNHTYASADTFMVRLISTSTQGCKDTLDQEVIVESQPVANFTVQNVCAYDSAQFTSTSISGGTLLNYAWDFGDGSSSFIANPSHLFPNSGIFLEKLTVTTPAGCSNTISKNITIYQVPIANFSVNNVCDSLPANFINLSSIGAGTLLNIWEFGDGNSSSVSNPSYTYSRYGTYSVELISTSTFGCADTIIGSATIYPRPKPNFGIPAVCEGAISVFSDSSSIASGFILSYAWDFGDGTNSIIKNPTKQYLISGVYPVTLVVNSDKGCSYDTTINAIVNVLPIADFSFISECNGDSISFANLSSISSGIINYSWNYGDGESSTETSPKHLFPSSGIFPTELLVVSNEGCSDSLTKQITVFSIPQPEAGNDTSTSKGYSIQLNATGGNNYFWFPNKGLSSSTIANPKANPMESTQYILTVIDNNGCIGYDTINVSIVDDYKIIANNIITPNGDGINDVWKIENISTFGEAELMIFDRWGKVIYNVTGYDNSWGGTSGSDILPDGTYYYVITFPTSSIVYNGSITILRDK